MTSRQCTRWAPPAGHVATNVHVVHVGAGAADAEDAGFIVVPFTSLDGCYVFVLEAAGLVPLSRMRLPYQPCAALRSFFWPGENSAEAKRPAAATA